MEFYYHLVFEKDQPEDETYYTLGRFMEDLELFSERWKLTPEGKKHWWERFDSTTKQSYLDECEAEDFRPNQKLLDSLPDSASPFKNYEELLQPLNAMLYHLTDPETLEEELDGEEEETDPDALLFSENLSEVIQELEDMRARIKLAEETQAGFYLHLVVDN